MTAATLAQARDLVRHLTAQLLQSAVQSSPTMPAPFPTFPQATWTPDLPQQREELYDDDGR